MNIKNTFKSNNLKFIYFPIISAGSVRIPLHLTSYHNQTVINQQSFNTTFSNTRNADGINNGNTNGGSNGTGRTEVDIPLLHKSSVEFTVPLPKHHGCPRRTSTRSTLSWQSTTQNLQPHHVVIGGSERRTGNNGGGSSSESSLLATESGRLASSKQRRTWI